MKPEKHNTNSSQEAAKQALFERLKMNDEDKWEWEDYTGKRFLLELAIEVKKKSGINILSRFHSWVNNYTEADVDRVELLNKRNGLSFYSPMMMKQDDLVDAVKVLSIYSSVLWSDSTLSLEEMLEVVNQYDESRGGSSILGGLPRNETTT